MKPTKIAVISDLHIGEAARAADLRLPARGKNKKSTHGSLDHEPFLDRFREFTKRYSVAADFLVVPGDITNKATPEEFDLAVKVVSAIATCLGVAPSNVIYIPGNHDVDWSVLSGEKPHALRLAQRFDPFCGFGKSFKTDPTSLTAPPYFSVRTWPSLSVVGYNSAWHDQPDVPLAHHGRVDPAHLAAIADHLRKNPFSSDSMRMFVVHHHPFQYMDFLSDWDDFSVMQNAEALQDLLSEFRFDLLIHGHKHYPNFNTQTLNAGHPVAVLGAGSFCRMLDTRWNGIVANQFHLIEVEHRDPDTAALCGQVKSWAYLTSTSWEKSYHTGEVERIRRRGTGIEHEKSFGYYCSPLELLKLVRHVVEKHLSNKPLLTVSEMCAAEPRLRFTPKEALTKALREYGATSNYAVINSDGERYLVSAGPKP